MLVTRSRVLSMMSPPADIETRVRERDDDAHGSRRLAPPRERQPEIPGGGYRLNEEPLVHS